jgi:hypothetical protein
MPYGKFDELYGEKITGRIYTFDFNKPSESKIILRAVKAIILFSKTRSLWRSTLREWITSILMGSASGKMTKVEKAYVIFGTSSRTIGC